MRPIEIIGLSGGAGTGKDYLAEHYARPQGFQPIALADEIKVRVVASGRATWEEVFKTKPPHVRTLLQEEGTERGRNVYGENYWIDVLWARLLTARERWGMTRWVVTDVRFPNEVTAVQAIGGKVFRIVAPKRYQNNGMTEAARQHPSERALDGFVGFDGWVLNDPEYALTVGPTFLDLLHEAGYIDSAWWKATSPTTGILERR